MKIVLFSAFLLIIFVQLVIGQSWYKCGGNNTSPSGASDCLTSSSNDNLCCFVTTGTTRGCYYFAKNVTYTNLDGTLTSDGGSSARVDCGAIFPNTGFFGVPYCGTGAQDEFNCYKSGSYKESCCYFTATFNAGPLSGGKYHGCVRSDPIFGRTALAQSFFMNSTDRNLTCYDGSTYNVTVLSGGYLRNLPFVMLLFLISLIFI